MISFLIPWLNTGVLFESFHDLISTDFSEDLMLGAFFNGFRVWNTALRTLERSAAFIIFFMVPSYRDAGSLFQREETGNLFYDFGS